MKPSLPFRPPHRDAEARYRNLLETLAAKPDQTPGVWLFVYGLLAENPPFRYVRSEPVVIRGWHRLFHLADPLNRGNGFAPGLTLGLAEGGECPGVAYLISDAEALEDLQHVWKQEMLLPFYRPSWVQQDGRSLLVMLTDRESPALWESLSLSETTEVIDVASGMQGTNRAYLSSVLNALRHYGVEDAYLIDVQQALK